MPATKAIPDVMVSNPVSIRTSVVFPAPLGPSSPEQLAREHFKVDRVDHRAIAEALGELAGLDGERRLH